MSLVCALSGKVPAEAVFSPQGYVFDFSEISNHLAKSAVCPFTGAALRAAQLRPLKHATPRNRCVLNLIEEEVYSAVADRHAVNLEIVKYREELKMTLLKVYAAEKISNELEAELAVLRARLEQLPKPGNMSDLEISEKIDDWESLMAGLPQAAAAIAAERRAKLKTRNDLQFPGRLEVSSSHSPHLSTHPGVIGIREISGKIVSAGNDGRLVFFDMSSVPVVSHVSSHPGLTAFDAAGALSLTGSSDGSLRLWLETEALADFRIFGKIKSAALSAAAPEIAAVGAEGKIHCVDLERQISRAVFEGFGESCIFHPDGRLVIRQGVNLEIYTFEDQKLQGSLPVKADIFVASENGVNLATADSDFVKLWDLRKPNLPVCEIEACATALVFDSSRGKNIFIAGEGGGKIYEYSSAALAERTIIEGPRFEAARFTADGLVAASKRNICFYRF